MNEILQIIGSVASILGVPLAIYLYLKSQVQKYAQVRREIVKRLSHQIGEGRIVGLFELRAVIDSLVRENRLRSGSITTNSIIEDLMAETVSSPLLESSRKENLITELSEAHSIGKVFQAIHNDRDTFNKFVEFLKVETGEEDDGEKLREQIESTSDQSRESSKSPELFGIISAFIGSIAAGYSISSMTDDLTVLPKILGSDVITNIMLGLGASIIAGAIVVFVTRITNDKSHNK